jgi:hypothetical protein
MYWLKWPAATSAGQAGAVFGPRAKGVAFAREKQAGWRGSPVPPRAPAKLQLVGRRPLTLDPVPPGRVRRAALHPQRTKSSAESVRRVADAHLHYCLDCTASEVDQGTALKPRTSIK